MIRLVNNVSYMTRGLLDHSLVTVILEMGEAKYLREGRISPLWMELIEKTDEVLTALRELLNKTKVLHQRG